MEEFAVNFAIAFVVILSAGVTMLLGVLCFLQMMESESIFAKIMWGILCLSIPSAFLALGETLGRG